MLHGFPQYHDPRVLTVLVDGEFWGGEGRIGGERSVRPCPFYLLQEAIDYQSFRNGHCSLGLLRGVIAEHGPSGAPAAAFGPHHAPPRRAAKAAATG